MRQIKIPRVKNPAALAGLNQWRNARSKREKPSGSHVPETGQWHCREQGPKDSPSMRLA